MMTFLASLVVILACIAALAFGLAWRGPHCRIGCAKDCSFGTCQGRKQGEFGDD